MTSASSRSPTACGAALSSMRVVACWHRLERQPLGLHALGDLAQRDLAQRGEVLELEEAVERRCDPLAGVDLAHPQTLDQRLGREVDQHHLVGRAEHPIR